MNGACVNTGEECSPACIAPLVCHNGVCIENTWDNCKPACIFPQVCEDGSCVECSNVCGNSCCKAGQSCDLLYNKCESTCDDGSAMCGGECCEAGYVCEEYGCSPVCALPELRCKGVFEVRCCERGEVCLDGQCAEDCGERIRCAASCCELGEVCEDERCKISCSGTRCGDAEELCCAEGTVCLFKKCITPGATCTSPQDCKLNEYCDEDSQLCIKLTDNPNQCVYIPPTNAFAPTVKWHWQGSVHDSAVVINLTDDNGDTVIDENDIPDVVFVSDGIINETTIHDRQLIALSGDTGELLAASDEKALYSNFVKAAADIDNDGLVEIITGTTSTNLENSGIYALNLVKQEDGSYKWVQKKFRKTGVHSQNSKHYSVLMPQIADLDQDGVPEIVTTRGVLKGDGDWSKWECELSLPMIAGAYIYMFEIADLDQDGNAEIIANNIFNNNCEIIIPEEEPGWYYVGVADLLKDENKPEHPGELVPEIVRVRDGRVSVWKIYKTDAGWSQRKIWDEEVAGANGGGNPIIADFDGDGQRDIGVAGYSHYTVFHGQTGKILWATKTQDETSERTGSSVFDFEGDGISEVVYRDETHLRIYSGPGASVDNDGDGYPDAVVLWEEPNTSGTMVEYPLIVDVDNDGKTEIVVVSNIKDWTPASLPTGVTVYADRNDNWVRTRRIWNQHAYHVTNILENGKVPKKEEANWLNPKYNNCRQNVQPEGIFNAPNFVALELLSSTEECVNNKLILTAKLENKGSVSAGKGMNIAFYIENFGQNKEKRWIGNVQLDRSMAPGEIRSVSFAWDRLVPSDSESLPATFPAKISFKLDAPLPGSGQTTGSFNECIETDNDSDVFSIAGCPAN
ncbi:MAG: hypothetical protein ACOX8U_07720 [Bradymonadia bacterium]